MRKVYNTVQYYAITKYGPNRDKRAGYGAGAAEGPPFLRQSGALGVDFLFLLPQYVIR
ncbi:MAG: hypothetical protein ACLSBB_13205 [Ruthenibacterium lactatiformans]